MLPPERLMLTAGLCNSEGLEALLNAALAHEPSLEPFRAACQKITAFYLVEGYPPIAEAVLTEDDVRNSWNQVQRLIDRLRREVAR